MRRALLLLAVLVAPARVSGQQNDPPVRTRVGDSTPQGQSESEILARFNAENRVKLETMLVSARKRNLPVKPMLDQLAKGKGKGEAEAEIVAGAAEVLNRLELSQQAFAKSGRRQPDPHEVALGAVVLRRGASAVQLEALIKSASFDRSLVVALDVLAQLSDRGLKVGDALAQVSAKLASRAPDAEIAALTAGLGAGVTKKP